MSKTTATFGLAACAALTAAIAVAAPAQAGPIKSDVRIQLPAAPSGSVQAASVAASAPGISPATRTSHVTPGNSFVCADGNLCASVWDATTSSWKIFYMYTCRTYSLSHWVGGGAYYDSQTGGVTSTFYGQSRNVLTSFRANHQTVNYKWDPVWYIKNC